MTKQAKQIHIHILCNVKYKMVVLQKALQGLIKMLSQQF